MDLISPLQILNSFLSGGGYLPANISSEFYEKIGFACLGHQPSANLQSLAQEPFRSDTVAFSEGFNCHIKQKQLSSELRFTGAEQKGLYYLG